MQQFTRGQIIALDGPGGIVRFQWNPREIEGPVYRAEYAALKTAGRETPFLQFSNGDVRHIRFDLEFSGQDNGPGWVAAQVETLQRLTSPVVRGAGMKRPVRVKFIFGSFLRKTCVVTEISPRFSGVFDPTGLQPYHARVGVTMWEYVA